MTPLLPEKNQKKKSETRKKSTAYRKIHANEEKEQFKKKSFIKNFLKEKKNVIVRSICVNSSESSSYIISYLIPHHHSHFKYKTK